MQRILKVLVVICVFISPVFGQFQAAPAEKFNVVFFSASSPGDAFWDNIGRTMQAACHDLDCDLTIYYAKRNPALMVSQFQEVANSEQKPDVAVYQSLKKNGPLMLQIAENAKIPSFLFNATLIEENIKKYGGPREQFTYWIGQMFPDDVKAGYDGATYLIEQAQKMKLTDASGKIHVGALIGNLADGAGIARNLGFMHALEEHHDVILHQKTDGQWLRDNGYSISKGLKQRYPAIQVIWAANDPMGLGVIDGMKALGFTPGKDVITSGYDWIPEALEAVKNGEMAISIGGHFMEGAWVIVLLYDYFHGIDFATETIDFRSSMSSLTQENIARYLAHFGAGDWDKIDFRKFSKKLNSDVKNYDFSFDAIFRQFD